MNTQSIVSLMKEVKSDKPNKKSWLELAKIWAHYSVMFFVVVGGFLWMLQKIIKPNVTTTTTTNYIENYYEK